MEAQKLENDCFLVPIDVRTAADFRIFETINHPIILISTRLGGQKRAAKYVLHMLVVRQTILQNQTVMSPGYRNPLKLLL